MRCERDASGVDKPPGLQERASLSPHGKAHRISRKTRRGQCCSPSSAPWGPLGCNAQGRECA